MTELDGVDAAVYGIPFDTATSYRTGGRFGPEAIRSVSALIRPYHPVHNLNVVEMLSIVDYGDLPVSPGDTERTYAQVEEGLAVLVDAASFRLRSAATTRSRSPSYVCSPRATAHSRRCNSMHTRTPGRPTSAKSTSTARRSSVRSRKDSSTRGVGPGWDARLGVRRLRPRNRAELGFTVIESERSCSLGPDVTARLSGRRWGSGRCSSVRHRLPDPAFAPGTGTPEVAGSSTAEALAFLRALRGIDIVGCDVVEVAPAYDGPGQPTALAAANVVFELLALRVLATPRQ